jgi:bifunctional DNase/RNase
MDMMGKVADVLTGSGKGLKDLHLEDGAELDATWVNVDSDEGESCSGSDWDSPEPSPPGSPRLAGPKAASGTSEKARSDKVDIVANGNGKLLPGSQDQLAPSTPETAPQVVKPPVAAVASPAPKPDFDLKQEYYQADLDAVQELAKDRTFKVTLKPQQLGTRPLQMFIGDAEGKALVQAFSGWKWHQQGCKRPLTYDFLRNVVESLGRKVMYVRICASERGVFYARAHFETAAGATPILGDATLAGVDSRPSDALNLALRFGAPIYVHRQLVTEVA